MNHSPELGDLAAALAKAQASMGAAVKDSTNPHFKSKFADLSSIWDAARKPLADNGLAIVQLPGFEAETGTVTLETTILHTSGQWISGVSGAPIGNKVDAQGVGSCITYLRRYCTAAALAMTSEDDDGNQAVAQTTASRPKHVSRDGEVILPGKPTAWDGHGGKSIKDVPEDVLTKVRNWMNDKDEKKNAGIVNAIDLELENRRAGD